MSYFMKQQERKDHVTKLVKPGEERRSEPFCCGLWLGRGQVGFEGRRSVSICPAVRSCPGLRRGLAAGGGRESLCLHLLARILCLCFCCSLSLRVLPFLPPHSYSSFYGHSRSASPGHLLPGTGVLSGHRGLTLVTVLPVSSCNILALDGELLKLRDQSSLSLVP